MVVVDRYPGWPIVQQSRDGSSGLVKCLREIFVTYGIADELSSDGGPEFTAEETQQLLSNWGVHHPLICCTCSLKWSRRARGQDLQAHAHGQHWPERRDQPRQISKRHASIPQHP